MISRWTKKCCRRCSSLFLNKTSLDLTIWGRFFNVTLSGIFDVWFLNWRFISCILLIGRSFKHWSGFIIFLLLLFRLFFIFSWCLVLLFRWSTIFFFTILFLISRLFFAIVDDFEFTNWELKCWFRLSFFCNKILEAISWDFWWFFCFCCFLGDCEHGIELRGKLLKNDIFLAGSFLLFLRVRGGLLLLLVKHAFQFNFLRVHRLFMEIFLKSKLPLFPHFLEDFFGQLFYSSLLKDCITLADITQYLIHIHWSVSREIGFSQYLSVWFFQCIKCIRMNLVLFL